LFFGQKKRAAAWAALFNFRSDQLTPIMVPVVIAVFVAIFPHFVAVPVCLMAIAVSISIPRYLPAAVPAVVAVMIIDYRALISRKAPVVAVVGIVIVPAAVVSVVVIPDAITEARVVAEARIVSESCFIRASPLPIFPLALTVEPVVFNIVVPALSQPFPIVRIVVSVVAAGSAICVWVVLIPMLRASSGQNRSRSQS
jgi:hypothetical protein